MSCFDSIFWIIQIWQGGVSLWGGVSCEKFWLLPSRPVEYGVNYQSVFVQPISFMGFLWSLPNWKSLGKWRCPFPCLVLGKWHFWPRSGKVREFCDNGQEMICRREIWRKNNNKINKQTLGAQTDKKRKIKNLFNFETLLDPVLIGVLHSGQLVWENGLYLQWGKVWEFWS